MAGQKVDELYWDLGANLAPLAGGIGQAQRMLGGLGKAIMTPIGMFATLGAVAALAGVKATRMAGDFDKALRELSTLLPTTVDQMGELRDKIVQLSTEVPQAPAQLTQGLYEVVSAGISNTTEAFKVLDVASRAATAGLTETTTVVNALTAVMNSYGMGADQATRVSDVLFQTVNVGVVRFAELATHIGDVANTAALANVPIEVVGAAIATMTQRGINAAESVTSLNRLILALMDSQGLGAEAAHQMGMEFGVAQLKAKGLQGMLEELYTATGGNVEKMQLILPELRAFRAASVLAGTGAEGFADAIVMMGNAVGTTEKAFGKMSGEVGNQWKLLTGKLNVAWLKFGEFTLPIVAYWLGKVNALLGATRGLTASALTGLDKLSDEQLKTAMAGAKATADQIRAEMARLGPVSQSMSSSDTERVDAVGKLKELEAVLAQVQGRYKTLEDTQERRRQLNAEAAAEAKAAEAERAAATGTLDAQLKGLEKRLESVGAASERAWDFDGWLSKNEEFRAALAETVDTAERLVMAQSSIAGMNADVEGLALAWAAMPRSMETTVVMLSTIRARMTAAGMTVDDLVGSNKALVAQMEGTLSPADQVSDRLTTMIADGVDLTRTLADAARAFGMLGDTGVANLTAVANVLQRVSEISGKNAEGMSNWGALGGLGKVNAVAGIAAGLGSLLQGVLSDISARNAEIREREQRRIEVMKENSEALDALTGAMAEKQLGGRIGALGQAASAVEAARAARQAALEDPNRQSEEWKTVASLSEFWAIELAKMGLSMQEIIDIAKELGITLALGEEGLAAFANAVAEINTRQIFQTFAGQLGMLRREFDLFDIDDPIERTRRLLKVLDQFTDLEVPDIDKVGAAGVDAFIKSFFKGLGSLSPAEIAALLGGGLTLEQILDLMGEIEGVLDGVAGGTEEGVTKAFQVSRSITEVTGNRIAGILTTVSYWGEKTALAVEALVGIMRPPSVVPPTPSEMASFMRSGMGASGAMAGAGAPVTVSVTWGGNIVVNGSADAGATAQAVASGFVEQVDRALGERLLGVRRARGLAMPDGLRS
ncbi:MAG: phage tail tape measure protein [Phycisphaerales bacterium]|jgi:TP901 family phage tail tape measure protein